MPRITEETWLSAEKVVTLDLYYSARGRHRKWRLFGIACCRPVVPLTPDPRFDALLDIAERFADGAATWEDVKKARRQLAAIRKEHRHQLAHDEPKLWTHQAVGHVLDKLPQRCEDAALAASFVFPSFDIDGRVAERDQVRLARDIFGNPFRPVAFAPEWRTSSAVGLAEAMYQSRDFGPMPVLADALEEAGCADADILSHCRGDGPHVRGCWVVDLVLGKA